MENIPFIADESASLWRTLEAEVLARPEVAGFGLIVAAAAGLTLLWFVLAAFYKLARAAHIAGTAAEIRRGADIGARVLVARGRNRNGGRVSEFMSQTARTHLKRFMFGGPFDVVDFPVRVSNIAQARVLLRQAGADVVVWGEGRKGGLSVVNIVRRSEATDRGIPEHRVLDMPIKRTDWTAPLSQAMAYAVARALRPALGRPADFRAERLSPVVETLEKILAEQPKMDVPLSADILDDYTAGALQLAISDLDGWKDRSVDIMRQALGRLDRARAPERWVTAKINLGRALKHRCENKFDPIQLQEAIGHLTDALEALRTEPRFKIAEGAATAISECQKMLGTRRRFSITKGGI